MLNKSQGVSFTVLRVLAFAVLFDDLYVRVDLDLTGLREFRGVDLGKAVPPGVERVEVDEVGDVQFRELVVAAVEFLQVEHMGEVELGQLAFPTLELLQAGDVAQFQFRKLVAAAV